MTTTLSQTKPTGLRFTIEAKDMTLERLIKKLQEDFKLKISYGADNIPLDKVISIKMKDASLADFMTALCRKTGLSYRIMDGFMILQHRHQVPLKQDSAWVKVEVVSEKLVVHSNQGALDSLTLEPIKIQIVEERISIAPLELPVIDSTTILPKKITVKTNLVPKAEPPRIYRKKKIDYRLAVCGSYDLHNFHFKTLADKAQKYSSAVNTTIGISFSALVEKKYTLSFSLLYSTKGFSYHRNFNIMNPNDPVSIPDVTNLDFQYVEVPLEVEYPFIRRKKLSVNLVPGFEVAVLVDKEEQTKYLTQGEPNTKYFLNGVNHFLWAPQVGIKFGYAFIDTVTFFVEPHYIRYMKPVNDLTMRSGCDVFRIQAGVQFHFKKS